MNICNNIPLYLYNEMTKEERREFEKHLNECPECRKTIELFTEIQETKAVYNAPSNILNSIFEETSRKKNIFSFSKINKFAIAAAIFLAIGLFSIQTNKKQASIDLNFSDNTYSSMEEMASLNSELDEFEEMFLFKYLGGFMKK